MPPQPVCFVLIPIGAGHHDRDGRPIDFDHVYRAALRPGIIKAGLRPLRDDELGSGGIVQKRAFEALLLCDYVIADLTTPNPNVLYELGIRHAARRSGTIAVTARPSEMPFAVRSLRCIRYELDELNVLTPRAARSLRDAVARDLGRIREATEAGRAASDSPVFELVPDWCTTPPNRGAAPSV